MRNGKWMVKASPLVVLAALALLLGCTGQPQAVPLGHGPEAARVSEARSFIAKAEEALLSSHLAEAIKSYISAISLVDGLDGTEAAAAADTARAGLARIAASLTIEAGSEWFDAKGNQVTGDLRDLARSRGIMPTAYLYTNLWSGKTPVGDAPISFSFVTNSGTALDLVTTDSYGKANTVVSAIGDPSGAAVIRAMPVFTAEGRTWAFTTVFRDFGYAPKAPTARLAALESGGSEGSAARTLDAVGKALSAAGLDCRPFDATVGEELFASAQSGQAEALSRLAAGSDASPSAYVVLVSIKAGPAAQVELGGRKYAIFTAKASTSFRILRRDGSLAFSLAMPETPGQGKDADSARDDAVSAARTALVAEIGARIVDLKAAF